MKRTLIVVAIAFTVLIAGCGGPGDAPEDEEGEPVEEEPGDEPGDEAGDEGNETPAGDDDEDEGASVVPSAVAVPG